MARISWINKGTLILGLLLLTTSPIHSQLTSDSPLGIRKLHKLSNPQVYALLSSHVRPLLIPQDQETFLKELEGQVPNWSLLHDQPNEELGERDSLLLIENGIKNEKITLF